MRSNRSTDASEVYDRLVRREEIALLDAREEASFASGHPLFAASLPLGRIETEVYDRIPRRNAKVVCYDDGEGVAERAARRLSSLGYSDVSTLHDGLKGWVAAGLETFIDVNVPSKAFGGLVDARLHPPTIEPVELQERIELGDDVLVFDVRRFDEYQTMNIPGSINVPGAELVQRFGALVPDARTLVVINCAGRTRSIIGTQSLRNAKVANEVVALRNGTIGWMLANLGLEHGANRRFPMPSRIDPEHRDGARSVALAAGVRHVERDEVDRLLARRDATTYCFDVRDPAEYVVGHLVGFRSAPGGQLVQETDHYAPVRGATIVLADDESVRADMTGSWLAQMGWDVVVLDDGLRSAKLVAGAWQSRTPPFPESKFIEPAELARHITDLNLLVLDLASSARYRSGHVPGSFFVLRSELVEQMKRLSLPRRLVLTSPDGIDAAFAAEELASRGSFDARVLAGGTAAWSDAGLPLEEGVEQWLSPAIDHYRSPYEGTDVRESAMRDYLEWEYRLVAQLERDQSHDFFVLGAPTVAERSGEPARRQQVD